MRKVRGHLLKGIDAERNGQCRKYAIKSTTGRDRLGQPEINVPDQAELPGQFMLNCSRRNFLASSRSAV